MKTRAFLTVLVVVVFALSIVVAGEKGEKSTKTGSAKKSMMHCCEGKDAKACSDKDMKHCDTKEAKASMKTDAKTEVKTENKNAEAK